MSADLGLQMIKVIFQVGVLIVGLLPSPPFIVQLVLKGLVVRSQLVELGLLLVVGTASAVKLLTQLVAGILADVLHTVSPSLIKGFGKVVRR